MEHLIDILRATSWPLAVTIAMLILRPLILAAALRLARGR